MLKPEKRMRARDFGHNKMHDGKARTEKNKQSQKEEKKP
jgi:hypothetical protein